MTVSPLKTLTLEAFLQLPQIEASPWMLDPDDYSVMVFEPNQSPQICRGDRPFTTPPEFDLVLTAEQVFNWLNVSDRHQP
jgi:hypothetical protein